MRKNWMRFAAIGQVFASNLRILLFTHLLSFQYHEILARAKASISDLAQQLGVSVSTISRALSDHPSISDATKKRVWKLAKELHYQPNHLAAGLRKGRSNLLGLLCRTLMGTFLRWWLKA
ncbi:LacI family DNA-binding transcriptional regulator [Hymenobacter sp. 5516J-16]|uniref:LacI family DNA-binding transcriptional regulator n=1 Tax=Hymenobacter sp. 5516J-16 TaxID=2932253 RepID=UPI001FD530C1|nr:LacI family DNA-binding transcriptional regulator [Hymenobacter sp. 5516J-16]UOQ75993.1 LacI family DNA-binding transcriptional regulator [Hymenobacter sp. 5516J-16]